MDVRHKILILESISLIGDGIKKYLEAERFQVTGIAASWSELNKLLDNCQPDVILLDLPANSNNSVDFVGKLLDEYPEIPVLVISAEEYSDFFTDYFIMGVSGIIFSTANPSILKEAILAITGGREFFPDEIIKILKSSLHVLHHSGKVMHKWGTPLTLREISVLRGFCKGLTFKEIGSSLNISPRTVESHKKNILSKLKIGSTADLIRYAIQHHLD